MKGGRMVRTQLRLQVRAWVWPSVIIALLGGQLVVCSVIIFASNSDPSVAVEPNYYQQALAWDQKALQRERNTQLGWSAILSVDSNADPSGYRTVEVSLSDRDGNAITGAAVQATAFHHAHARERFESEFRDLGEGRYAARFPLKSDGLCEFRIVAQRNGEIFTLVREQTIGFPGRTEK